MERISAEEASNDNADRLPIVAAAGGFDPVQQHRGPKPGLSCDADIGFAGSSLCGSRSVQPR